MKDKKKVLIGILSVLICIMAIGYALLAQELTINGRASIDSTWKVEITNITQKELVGGVTEKSKSYTSTTANFSVGFTQPGDYLIYDIEVTNSGTLDAVISNINVVTDNNPSIIYTTSGLKRGDTISKNGNKKYLTVKIEYDSNITSQPVSEDNDITIQMDYQQDLGQIEPNYDYVIGDTVEFAGSNWYVIKNSKEDDDYVTLLKETILDYTDLTKNYAITTQRKTMGYYWSNTCHDNYTYGTDSYNNSDTSGCAGHNDYEGSKVKEFLEGTYINTLGETNLKEIDGYKIRLITIEELKQNMGLTDAYSLGKKDQGGFSANEANKNVPQWIYLNYGGELRNVQGYWTMSSCSDNSRVKAIYFWDEQYTGNIYYLVSDYSIYSASGVRPVINLLKSAIE